MGIDIGFRLTIPAVEPERHLSKVRNAAAAVQA
jgi:hypothetical protein